MENEPINQLHGSASCEEAEREINFFFPQQRTLAVIKPDAMEEHRGHFKNDVEMFKFTFVYNISSIHSNRKYFGGDPWQRFLCHTAEGDGAVEGDGWGVLQRAQGEAFFQPAGGIHESVSLSQDTATGAGQSDHCWPVLISVAATSFNSTFNSNLSRLESRQP